MKKYFFSSKREASSVNFLCVLNVNFWDVYVNYLGELIYLFESDWGVLKVVVVYVLSSVSNLKFFKMSGI